MNQTMPKPKRNDSSVKIESGIVRKARLITDFRDATLAEYLSDLLRPLVERDYDQFKRDIQQEDKKPRQK